jgi:putative DNA primase/helicase
MAQVDQRIAMLSAAWDSDPWLLATPSGTVDLKTGRLREAEPNDYISRQTAVAPSGEATRWLRFLAEATQEDQELQKFLQRVAGYCLTGLVREEAMFFFYGTGGNGKGTFLESLLYAMGEYGTTVAMGTLVQAKGHEHPTEIAKLLGSRLAVAQETEEGARWNIAKIKTLTGADRLTARFMRQDYFEFEPTHKLIASGNRKPALGRVDPAIKRRMNLILFTASFVGREDTKLKAALRNEAGGILGWAIEGCLEWQRVGLAPPNVVTAATDEYLHDQDDTQVWIEECCVAGRGFKISTKELFASWARWCESNGAYVGSRKAFVEVLKGKGYTMKPGTDNMTIVDGLGIALDEQLFGPRN